MHIINDDHILTGILNAEIKLENHFKKIIIEDNKLSRQLVSFQADKKNANFRWYKYKEAFSSCLVEYLIEKFNLKNKTILDPFAGIGTTLFTASNFNCNSTGIELLQVGQKIIETRINARYNNLKNCTDIIKKIIFNKAWNNYNNNKPLNELKITRNAYPEKTKNKIEKYISFINDQPDNLKDILYLALLSILEEISYTRKDGQYLRWDYRANRSYGTKKFDKGIIKEFDSAIAEKLTDIINDLNVAPDNLLLFQNEKHNSGNINLIKGSCLEHLKKISNDSFDAVITSPPYCNRYDYTRTYALELSLLGINETQLLQLRQEMLTCTVENREKDLANNNVWEKPINIAKNLDLLIKILDYLNYLKSQKKLNNNGIVRMIKGYFYELSCVIYELYRILNNNGLLIMVNDNVRYAGINIPVDLILSEIAEKIGFKINNILVLPQKKGNSSQQMSNHGRTELRKCVYVWEKM